MRHVLARLVEIRLRHHRVLAHDVQRTDAALVRVTEYFSGGETEFARETAGLDVPRLFPFARVVFVIDACSRDNGTASRPYRWLPAHCSVRARDSVLCHRARCDP